MYLASITIEEMKNMQQEWFNHLGGIYYQLTNWNTEF